MGTLLERGLIEESGRSRFGAALYRTTELFEKLFGLTALDALPDPAAFDPSPEEEGELRERPAARRASSAPRRARASVHPAQRGRVPGPASLTAAMKESAVECRPRCTLGVE